MACSCKDVKHKEPNINEDNSKKRGVMFFLGMINKGILKIVEKIFVIFLFIILVPIIILMLIFSYLVTGQLRIVLPKKLLNVVKRISNDE